MRFVHVLMFIHISDHFEGFRVRNVTRFRIGVVLFVKVNPDRKEVGVNSIAKKSHITTNIKEKLILFLS